MKQRQENLYEFEASMVYKQSSRAATRVVNKEKPCLGKNETKEVVGWGWKA